MLQFMKANDINLGAWQNLAAFAKAYNSELLLEGDNFTPSAQQWSAVLIEMPDGFLPEEFVCRAVTHLQPDEVKLWNHDNRRWLRLWFD